MRTVLGTAVLLLLVIVPALGAQFGGPVYAASIPPPTGARTIGYGVNTIAAPDRLDRAKSIGFNWVKLLAAWKNIQTSRTTFDWKGLDGDIERANSRGMRILLRVDQSPAWASGTDAYNAPPINDADFGDFMAALAARYKGRIQAYEIWNEPNLKTEWGGRQPDPGKYARMLKDLYPKVKRADPNAIIVTGGLATTGDGGPGDAWGDTAYLRAMYEAGAKGSFDAIGSHPYGGPYPPEASGGDAPLGVYFRRAEEHHAIGLSFGDDVAVWSTEVGWLYNQDAASCNIAGYDGYHALWQVSEDTQADYLVRAFKYAAQNWPWSGPLFVYNQDFAVDPWRVKCDPNRFFSIVRGNGAPLAAMTALAAMPRYEQDKPVAKWGPLAPVEPQNWSTLSWSGSDATSGVASFQAQYRILPSGEWKDLVDGSNVGDTSLMIDTEDRTTYQFRIQPMDWAGNRGAWVESHPMTVSESGYLSATVASLNVLVDQTAGVTTTLTLVNYGGQALNWGARGDQPWMALSPANGHLGPGQQTQISVAIAPSVPSAAVVGSVVLTSTGWQTGGPVMVNARVASQIRTTYIPYVPSGQPSIGAASAAPTRRVSLRGR